MYSINKSYFFSILIFSLSVNTVKANSVVSLFSAPNGFWLINRDPVTNKPYLYGPTSSNATWNASQWGHPGSNPANILPAFSNNITQNGNQRVVWTPGSNPSWEMAVSGANLNCDIEFDGFFGPNKTNTYPDKPAAGINSQPLSTMNKLIHKITLTHKYVKVINSACSNTSGNHLTAIVFKNIVNNNTFFYQLRLKPLVGEEKNPNGNWWWATSPNYGFGDSIKKYGKPSPNVGQTISYEIDILPRIKSVIADGHISDTDLSHWVVSGTYHGTHIWGHLNSTSVWSNFSLEPYYK